MKGPFGAIHLRSNPLGASDRLLIARRGSETNLNPTARRAPILTPQTTEKPIVKQALADALEQRGYDTLTQVQVAVTDPELAQSDLLVSAQTGSGKTVGFGLAIAPTVLGDQEQFGPAGAPLALVIAPTRELALQVKRELGWLYAQAGAIVTSCVGGMDMRDERRALARGAHIVVATPGRLRDHIMRGSIDLTMLRAAVLDEADEMLDLGFREDLEFILGESPETRRTLLFSATVPRAITHLAQRYQKDAVRVTTTAEKSQHSDIEYVAMNVAPRDGENAIINVLRYFEAPNALVFCNTRAMVNRLTTRLSNRGFSVVSLSGELSQSERTHALQAMRDGRARVCVATDVAARGIDLPKLDLVIHAELPSNHETMLHRSGRTGRAGRKGVSALIVPPQARKKSERILKFAKVTAQWQAAPSASDVRERDQERLLSDPMWEQPAEAAEEALIASLSEKFDAQQLATAFVRLFNTRHSAPEELSDPGAPSEPRPRVAFGPSVWFSVSGGREAGAEPRRLLPMLCKAGNLSKDDIGAIRVQQSESFVELREASVAGFLQALDGKVEIEEGAVLTQLSEPPVLAPQPRKGFGGKPGGKPGGGKPYGRKSDAPYRKNAGGASRKYDDKPRDGDGPKAKKPYKAPKPEHTRPEGVVSAPKPRRSGAGAPASDKSSKPRNKPKGPPPPVGKASSKKNRARAKAAAAQKKGKGGNATPRRKPGS